MQIKIGYHHGALREALLIAAEKILREQGLADLSLRAIAREAGVSHGAPGHHFPDLAALLSELAAVGFQRLADALRPALDGADGKRVIAERVYVVFALENPALFTLMFREERLDATNPSLRAARLAATAALFEVSDAPMNEPTLEQLARAAAMWSLVHGFAVLAVGQAACADPPPCTRRNRSSRAFRGYSGNTPVTQRRQTRQRSAIGKSRSQNPIEALWSQGWFRAEPSPSWRERRPVKRTKPELCRQAGSATNRPDKDGTIQQRTWPTIVRWTVPFVIYFPANFSCTERQK